MNRSIFLKIWFLITFAINFSAYSESKESIDDIIDSLSEEVYQDSSLSNKEINDERSAAESLIYKPKAKVIILNKITAKSEPVIFELGKEQARGNVTVEVLKCVVRKDPVKSSNMMLIRVKDKKLDNDKSIIFAGWMSAENLSISTLEHPVYDIIPRECID